MCSKRPSPNLTGLCAFVGLRTRRILALSLTRMGHWNQRTARASLRAGRKVTLGTLLGTRPVTPRQVTRQRRRIDRQSGNGCYDRGSEATKHDAGLRVAACVWCLPGAKGRRTTAHWHECGLCGLLVTTSWRLLFAGLSMTLRVTFNQGGRWFDPTTAHHFLPRPARLSPA
jgi:hypothetical protein